MFRYMEISNIVTGIVLLVIGGTYMYKGSIESGTSWLIFGSMYLVMDSYVKKTYLRAVFCLLGMVGSTTFLAYIWLLK